MEDRGCSGTGHWGKEQEAETEPVVCLCSQVGCKSIIGLFVEDWLDLEPGLFFACREMVE